MSPVLMEFFCLFLSQVTDSIISKQALHGEYMISHHFLKIAINHIDNAMHQE